MEAVVLVGGQGTRLQPLTLRTPKPMLPFAGAPFLSHLVTRLRAAGVEHLVLATSYRPEVFHEFFGTGRDFGMRIDFVTETEPLGTGGGIRNVLRRLESGPDDPVLVLNGDVLSGHDIRAQLEMHRRRDAAVTLHLVEVEDARAFGCVPTDSHARVTGFIEKSDAPVTNRINAGCYVFSRKVIEAIPEGRVVSVERETFPELLESGAMLIGYVDTSYWLDVGTPASFVKGSSDIVTGVLESPALIAPPGEALLQEDAVVHSGAVVNGGSVIGPRSKVDAGAQVTRSVIGDGVQIAAGATVFNSLVGRRAKIGQRTVVANAVIGEGASIGADNELTSGIRIWNDAVVADGSMRFSPLA
ncbi:MAG TPA: NDP-sugar synthase [Mycobacteriales bacterium]|nr:NDP-sugar synthase [Mycobacteriales bacterium]